MDKKVKLPDNWKWVTIDDIGIVINGGTPSTKDPEYWSDDIPWVTPADLSNHKDIFISKGSRNISKLGLEYSSAKLLPKNSILFSSRAPIGYVAIAKNELATNQGFKNIIVFEDYINPKYVYYYLTTIKETAEKIANGTTFLELSTSNFKKLPFPLAPIEEQNIIVKKIDELFSNLDTELIQLEQSKQKIELAKKKILEESFNIEKTEKLKELVSSITYGYTTKSFKTNKSNSLKYLRITDIQNGSIDWDKVPYCEAGKEDIEKYKIKSGDIMFARSGNTVGKSILIKTHPFSLFASYLIRIRCDLEKISPKYLSYFFQSEYYWDQINNDLTGIGQPNFNGTKLSNLLIPITSIEEQDQITKRVENTFDELSILQIEIQKSLENLSILKKKILFDIFSGKNLPHLEKFTSIESILSEIVVKKNIFSLNQSETEKKKEKRKIFDLESIIKENFKNNTFSYLELSKKVNVSNERLAKEFDRLEHHKVIRKFFDLKSGSIKYLLE